MKKRNNKKFIFVTGGVVSSIGKGLTAASLGALLEARGCKVSIMKFDPYLNVDPGTMSPLQHGEVFVTDDGAETDLDLGHYERFTNSTMTRANSVSAGQVYESVISNERQGTYLGGTVQVIPHVTDEIKKRMWEVAQKVDITLVEIGGTVGDIEGQPFLEAIRQMRLELGYKNSVLVHVTYIPYIKAAGELKSKPTQHSVKELRSLGLQPDVLVCRSDMPIEDQMKKKIGQFCSVLPNHVIAAEDSNSIYEVPLALHQEKLDAICAELLGLSQRKKTDLKGWKSIAKAIASPTVAIKIAVVGKYVDLKESYKSLNESLVHASFANHCATEIIYVDSEKLNLKNIQKHLGEVQAILVPGGFGTRGVNGKILAIQYARENKIPYFGICFGMQLMALEFAKNVCQIESATSREFLAKNKDSDFCVIDFIPEQRGITQKGGTMRLGAYPCHLKPQSLAHKLYKATVVSERHRHRYEFNNDFIKIFEQQGMVFSGKNKTNNLVEIMEFPGLPFFIGVQFHPEFKSKPLKPHPVFNGFIKAAIQKRNAK